MNSRHAFGRTLFVALSVTLAAFASVRCAQPSDEPTGQASGDAADEPTTTATMHSDAASDAPTCSGDLRADPKNCGRCGHDCLGGGCNAGTCQPIILASEQLRPTEIALDATHVYFAAAAGSSILRVPVKGGPVDLVADDATLGSNIALDDAYVYFMTGGYPNGGVARAPKAGKPDGGSTTIATAGFPVAFFALDDANVYWTGGRFTGGAVLGGVYEAPKGSMNGVGNKLVPALAAETTSVAVDDTNVYFANVMGRIFSVTKGGTVGLLATAQTGATGLLADGKRVYWANGGQGSIVATDKPAADAGAATLKVLAAGQNQPARIALDDVAIYFTSTGSGTIGSCPRSGCTDVVRLVASDQAAPLGIAVDAVAVYWANSGNGTIMKVAK